MQRKLLPEVRRILFLKHTLSWPRSSGHDVYTFNMMKGLAGLGQQIGLTTCKPVSEEALADLRLAFRGTFADDGAPVDGAPLGLSAAQERFRSYWGVKEEWIQRLAAQVSQFRADALVLAGLETLPYLAAAKAAVRVWYAADEWMLHHLTLIRPTEVATWRHLREGIVKAGYERVFAKFVDRAWVVSDTEARAMRWFAGMRAVDVVPLGVDTDIYHPQSNEAEERTAVFWGRLDFDPNVQALRWFCRKVWPGLRQRVPDARFTIIGFQPSPEVRELARLPGLTLLSDLPDLREAVSRRAVAVFPFVSGAGSKNKILEAAALGRPIVCTPRAHAGLSEELRQTSIAVRDPRSWIETLEHLWADPSSRRELGNGARAAVIESHSWTATASKALAGINSSIGE